MDLQKEKEAFEAWVGSNGRSIERFSDDSYKSMTLDKEWEAWQAAKAQAVQQGFVLVPKEPTPKMIDAADNCAIAGKVTAHIIYKSMIEAQEQNGVNNEPN